MPQAPKSKGWAAYKSIHAKSSQYGEILSETIGRFNQLCQDAYDAVMKRQRNHVIGSVGKKFAKLTLEETISSAIGTFGIGQGVDAVNNSIFGEKAMSSFTETFGGNLLVNVQNEVLGQLAGIGQGALTDLVYEKGGELLQGQQNRKARDFIDDDSRLPGSRAALTAIPPLKTSFGIIQNVNAHSFNRKFGTQGTGKDGKSIETNSLLKEVAHQVDQTARAFDSMYELAKKGNRKPTFDTMKSNGKKIFRKCRVAADFFCSAYWFRRKFNKLCHFLGLLKTDYAKSAGMMNAMEEFWRNNIRKFEEAVFYASKDYQSKTQRTGTQEHLLSSLVGGEKGTGAISKGDRNWRK